MTPTIQQSVKSSWHALIKCHASIFTEIGLHWTHTLPQLLNTSWRCRKYVQDCLRRAHKYSMGFKSGDCACHCGSWNGCDANHSCTLLLVCLESLSCWNTNLLRSKLKFVYGPQENFQNQLVHNPIRPTFNFVPCSPPPQKPSYIPKLSLAHHHASRFDGYVEVQRVLHLQSNTMT